jgi:hypothetical protein
MLIKVVKEDNTSVKSGPMAFTILDLAAEDGFTFVFIIVM